MGIRNIGALTTNGCQAVIDGEVCGRELNAVIHRATNDNGHNYLETNEHPHDHGYYEEN